MHSCVNCERRRKCPHCQVVFRVRGLLIVRFRASACPDDHPANPACLLQLIAGLSFGAAYGSSAHLIQTVDAFQGHALGAATSALLAAAMGARAARTRKLMPAGLLTGIGLAAFAYHAQKAWEWA